VSERRRYNLRHEETTPRRLGVANLPQHPVTCKHIAPDATVVELTVPPQPRVD
jgi:hypothetical protein